MREDGDASDATHCADCGRGVPNRCACTTSAEQAAVADEEDRQMRAFSDDIRRANSVRDLIGPGAADG
jgi:hypothetical protein